MNRPALTATTENFGQMHVQKIEITSKYVEENSRFRQMLTESVPYLRGYDTRSSRELADYIQSALEL